MPLRIAFEPVNMSSSTIVLPRGGSRTGMTLSASQTAIAKPESRYFNGCIVSIIVTDGYNRSETYGGPMHRLIFAGASAVTYNFPTNGIRYYILNKLSASVESNSDFTSQVQLAVQYSTTGKIDATLYVVHSNSSTSYIIQAEALVF